MKEELLLEWAKKIKSISQIGLTYGTGPYDLERYHQLSDLADEMFTAIGQMDLTSIQKIFLGDSGYATPKVDLRGSFIQDGKILLVKERSDGRWTLPGGWADVCESPAQGIQREILEESGFQVKVNKCVAVLDRNLGAYEPVYPHHVYKLLFLCECTGGEKKLNIEIEDIDFFAQDALPTLSTERVIQRDIDLLFAHHADTSLPVTFE